MYYSHVIRSYIILIYLHYFSRCMWVIRLLFCSAKAETKIKWCSPLYLDEIKCIWAEKKVCSAFWQFGMTKLMAIQFPKGESNGNNCCCFCGYLSMSKWMYCTCVWQLIWSNKTFKVRSIHFSKNGPFHCRFTR